MCQTDSAALHASDVPRSKRHSEDRVTRLEQCDEHGLIGLRAGMRLHIGEAAPEEALGALDRERLGDIDEFASDIISAAGITFGVFVCQHRALDRKSVV